MVSLSFEPHNQERYTQRGKTTLWYTNVDYHEAHKGLPPPVLVKGQMIVSMPKLGEAIILDEVYAADVELKTRYRKGAKGVARSAFTRHEHGGQEMAHYIKEALARGVKAADIEEEMSKIKFSRTLAEVEDETLLEALKERFPDAPEELLAMLKSDRVAQAAPKKEKSAEEELNPLVSEAHIQELTRETGQPSVAGLYKSKPPTNKKGIK